MPIVINPEDCSQGKLTSTVVQKLSGIEDKIHPSVTSSFRRRNDLLAVDGER